MKVYALSGGEQKVALARILLKPSDLVLADEPTGSLDAGNRDEVLRLLRELNTAGKAIVVVSHDQNVAQACDRVIELEQLQKTDCRVDSAPGDRQGVKGVSPSYES